MIANIYDMPFNPCGHELALYVYAYGDIRDQSGALNSIGPLHFEKPLFYFPDMNNQGTYKYVNERYKFENIGWLDHQVGRSWVVGCRAAPVLLYGVVKRIGPVERCNCNPVALCYNEKEAVEISFHTETKSNDIVVFANDNSIQYSLRGKYYAPDLP